MADNSIATAYVRILPEMTGIKSKLAGEMEAAGSSTGGKFSSAFGTAAKVGLAGLTAAGGAITAFAKSAVSSFADYEQLIGGVETLFGTNAQKVLHDAEDAYKTAGMSVNEYMETSIQSAAAMINSLGGDQAKAADLMNLSITDMADNVNKMGTSMESVQNAYRGFSRGNFTMLDNLALGFAGTKEGMQQLLDKAQEISGIQFDINSYSDIVQAIHVVQEEMGITGTTAKEAEKTISGSIASLKSAWSNLVAGLGRDDVDLDRLINNVVNSAETAFNNIIPVAEKVIDGIVRLIEKIAPILEEKLPPLIEKLLPAILRAGTALIKAIVPVLPKLVGTLLSSFFDTMVTQAPEFIPVVALALGKPLMGIINTLSGGFGTLKSAISGLSSPMSGLSSSMGGLTSAGGGLSSILSTIGTAALGAADALLVLYDVQALQDAAKTYEEAQQTHIDETENAMSLYAQLYQEKGKEVADEWANMVYQLDTTSMSFDEAQSALASQVDSYWDGVPQNMWDGFKQGWDSYFGENGTGLLDLLGDAFTGAVDGIKGILGIHSPSTVFDGIGQNLMAGLQKGIIEGALHVIETAKGVAQNILNAIKGFFGINSPSTIMAEMGGYLDAGLAEGIIGNISEPQGAMQMLSDRVQDAFSQSNDQVHTLSSRLSNPGRNSNVQSMDSSRNLTVILELDRVQFGRAVYRMNNEETQRVGVQLAKGYM